MKILLVAPGFPTVSGASSRVVGSFIVGLDVDEPGIGRRIADAASQYGADNLNLLILTPLPGTHLWDQMKVEGRIALNAFPEDGKCICRWTASSKR